MSFCCCEQLQRYDNLTIMRPQKLGVYGINNPQALSSAITSLEHYSPGHSGCRLRRLIAFEVLLLFSFFVTLDLLHCCVFMKAKDKAVIIS